MTQAKLDTILCYLLILTFVTSIVDTFIIDDEKTDTTQKGEISYCR